MYYVYILISRAHGRYYIGQTEDVSKRMNRHNSGTERSTSPYKPWELLWCCTKTTRQEAMQLEKKLKNLSRERLEAFIKKYPSSPILTNLSAD
ncbi:MAG: GIY-YIG nuclease family protein [Bacteroidetes bacterium]|nr:GIY-YIG nuclease family protein [Bacteroidota bacterium]